MAANMADKMAPESGSGGILCEKVQKYFFSIVSVAVRHVIVSLSSFRFFHLVFIISYLSLYITSAARGFLSVCHQSWRLCTK